MAKRDYYDVLGVDKGSDEASIKKAYRALAMKYHPDRNQGDTESSDKMKEINEAYAVLSDRNKRGLYDTYGHAGLEGYTQEDIFRGVDFTSIFDELFGGGGFSSIFGRQRKERARQPQRGADLRYDLSVSLEDVAFGKEMEIVIPRVDTCSACKGTGAKEGGLKECKACRGSGQRVIEQRSGSTLFRQIAVCPDCNGKGREVTNPCDDCKGRGSVEDEREIHISIPRGADSGYAMKIEGEGATGLSGNGDLYVVLEVENHPVFERHGDDIYVLKEVEFPQAALGGEIHDIPGLEGNVSVDIPQGTQNGEVLRIIDVGVPHLGNHGRGDQYVVIKVMTPMDLTEEEEDLLRRFHESRKQREYH